MDAVSLESERLILRPIRESDALTLLAGGRPYDLRFAEGYPAPFSLEVMDLIAGERKSEVENFDSWFIIRKTEGDVIGEIGGSAKDGSRIATAGYGIVEPLWGRGYTTEA